MSSFVYNVVNKNEESISAKFKFIHTNTNKISDIRETNADNQIVFDTDDADIDNQEYPFKIDDLGLLIVYNDLGEFAMIKIISDGSDVYSGTIQLLISEPPKTILLLDDSFINEDIILDNISSDEFIWLYKDIIHYHTPMYDNFNIFENVKIINVLYKMNDNEYNINNIYNISESGEYIFTVEVENYYGQKNTNSKTIKIYKHEPIINITHSPIYPKTLEEYTINISIDNFDNNFISSSLYNNNELYNNTNIINTYIDKQSLYNDNIIYTLEYVWFDGFNNITSLKEYIINMQLITSSLELNVININNDTNTYTIEPTIVKGDGEFYKLIYDVYYSLPFTNNEILVKNLIYNNIDDLILNLQIINSGSYKITGTLIDEFGGEIKNSIIIDATCNETSIEKEQFHNIVFDRE